MYTKKYNKRNELTSIYRSDGATIPISEYNSDYRKYLDDIQEDPLLVIDEPFTDTEILDFRKQEAKNIVSQDIGKRINEGFIYNGDVYKIESEKDFINYLSLKVCSDNGYFTERNIPSAKVSKKDGKKKEIPVANFRDIAYACMDHVFVLRMEGQQKDEEIDACTTIEQLQDLGY